MKKRKLDKIFAPGDIDIEDYLMRLSQRGQLGYSQSVFLTILKLQNNPSDPLCEVGLAGLLAESAGIYPNRVRQSLGWLVENYYLKPGKSPFTFTLIDIFCCYRWVGAFPIPKTSGSKSL